MFFKPRIFISSLLKDKISLRNDISKMLEKNGFEVLVYEKNLTPSTDSYTYRKDIKDSDFVIFILDEHYGTLTPTGYSGVEEEFKIVADKKIKFHVYLKKTDKTLDEKEAKFLETINSKGISYFMFKDENDLKKRISNTVAIISKEISLAKINSDELDEKSNLLLAFNHDYRIAIDMLSVFEEILKISTTYDIDLISTNILFPLEYLEKWFAKGDIFNDCKLADMFRDFFKCTKELLNELSIDYTSNSLIGDIDLPIYGKVPISRGIESNPQIDKDKKYKKLLNKLCKRHFNLKEYLKERKYKFDIMSKSVC